MATIRVVRFASPALPHLEAFAEVGPALVEALATLGHRVTLSSGEILRDAHNILVGWHALAPEARAQLPDGTVLYNFEQLAGTPLVDGTTLGSLSRFRVWDYSRKNCDEWARHGVAATHVPLGYTPCLRSLPPSAEQDIDVLFYGSVNPRRRAVLEALAGRGVAVQARFGVYGAERDALIARSKLVLNVAFYEDGILEVVRLFHLWANAVPVVSERSARQEVPAGLDELGGFVPYSELVPTVLGLLADRDARAELGRQGFERFASVPWPRVLAPAVAELTARPPRQQGRTRGGAPSARPRPGRGGRRKR